MLEWVSSEWKNINREWASLFITHTVTHWGAWVREEVVGTRERERLLLSGDHLYVFGFYFWCWFYLWGSCGVFSFMVSPKKIICVSYLLCCAYVLLMCLLFSQLKDPKIIMLAYMIKKYNMVSELAWEEDIVKLQNLGILTFWVSLHNPWEKGG